MLSPSGKLIGDFTVSCLDEDSFFLIASFSAQAYHMRWFVQHLPETGVNLRNVSTERVGFQIAGPDARRLLASAVMADVSNTALPFLAVDQFDIGVCRAHIQRISYTGDLGYEIYVDQKDQVALYEALSQAGTDFQMKPFGMRAMMSLRLEKSFCAWMREYRPDYMPTEVGLERFVDYDKTREFIGKTSVLRERETDPKRRLCTFLVDANDADVHGDEPIWLGDEVVGFATSGGFAHYVCQSLALGFLPVSLIAEDREVEIEILGDRRKAVVKRKPLFDPQGIRMRT